MKQVLYPFLSNWITSWSLPLFFTSVGTKGEIIKLVKFSETNLKGLFNLAFGDKTAENEINDLVVSNNGDAEKVLATIVSVV